MKLYVPALALDFSVALDFNVQSNYSSRLSDMAKISQIVKNKMADTQQVLATLN